MANFNGKLVFLLCSVLMHSCSDAYKLLVLFTYPGKSHGILGEAYVRHLINAGHEVTYIASVPLKYELPGLRQIDVSSNFDIYPIESFLSINQLMYREISISDGLTHFVKIVKMMNATIHNAEVQKLMMDPGEQFDAVIVEWMFSELYSGFASVFGCPLIWSSSMEPHHMVLSLMDDSPNPAYLSDFIMTQAKMPFTFPNRVMQLLFRGISKIFKQASYSLEVQLFTEGYGPAATKRGRQLPTLDEVKYNASLMLANSHVSLGYAITLPQSYKPIGGYHIEEKTKPLPKELQTLMDGATHGVIYFSMGTMLKSNELPDEVKNGILDVFRSLKQTVIWKFEETLPNMPKNVHIVNWAPQQTHPNCILFISHGGLLSTTEAVHFGVPMIGVPIFGDQFNNINCAEHKGFGKRVDYNHDLPANLKVAIDEILGNSRYRDIAKEMSFVYHHRLMSPGAELVHWVEHVIMTKGAKHLRSPALDLPLYQKIYLDLVALLALIVIVITYSCKFLCRSCKSKKKVDVNKKKK